MVSKFNHFNFFWEKNPCNFNFLCLYFQLHDSFTLHYPLEIPNSASLVLQILLFINVYLSPIWMISSLQFYYMHAFDESGKHSTIVLGGALFLIAAPLEICRLYLGYSGNLRENVRFTNFFELSLFSSLKQVFFFYK